MKKLLEFFSGKSTQISIISVALCLVIAVSAGVAIHNNKRVENALNALSSTSTTEGVSESTGETETSTESTTETTSKKQNKITTTVTTSKKQNKTTTTVTEPAGDRTAQYIAEYNRITKEYEEQRARIESQGPPHMPGHTNYYRTHDKSNFKTDEEYESHSKEVSEHNSLLDRDYSEHCSNYEETKKEKLKKLDEQYESDIRELKREFGIFE